MSFKGDFLLGPPVQKARGIVFPCENAVASCDASDFCLPFEIGLTHTHFQGIQPDYYKWGGLSKFSQSNFTKNLEKKIEEK